MLATFYASGLSPGDGGTIGVLGKALKACLSHGIYFYPDNRIHDIDWVAILFYDWNYAPP